jgi:hypothetical protein
VEKERQTGAVPCTTRKEAKVPEVRRHSVAVHKKQAGKPGLGICAYLCKDIGEMTACFFELANMYTGLEYDVFAHLGTPAYFPMRKARHWKGAIDLDGHAKEGEDAFA